MRPSYQGYAIVYDRITDIIGTNLLSYLIINNLSFVTKICEEKMFLDLMETIMPKIQQILQHVEMTY